MGHPQLRFSPQPTAMAHRKIHGKSQPPKIGLNNDFGNCVAVWSDFTHGMCSYGLLNISKTSCCSSKTNKECYTDLHSIIFNVCRFVLHIWIHVGAYGSIWTQTTRIIYLTSNTINTLFMEYMQHTQNIFKDVKQLR